MSAFRSAVNDANHESFSHRMRSRRFAHFEQRARALGTRLRIIDLGGTTRYWQNRQWSDRPDVTITLINPEPQAQLFENIIPVIGDACNVDYEDRSFDIAFSNSVIEHLGTFQRQLMMARQVRRLARAYWVQTPNRRFPIEPHFLVPGWQWLPERARVEAVRRWRVGQRGPHPDPDVAREMVTEIRLLNWRELQRLFPGAQLVAERLGGLVKSWTVVYGM
jgi:hypothetical protein